MGKKKDRKKAARAVGVPTAWKLCPDDGVAILGDLADIMARREHWIFARSVPAYVLDSWLEEVPIVEPDGFAMILPTPLVSLPHMTWHAVVLHGVPRRLFTFKEVVAMVKEEGVTIDDAAEEAFAKDGFLVVSRKGDLLSPPEFLQLVNVAMRQAKNAINNAGG